MDRRQKRYLENKEENKFYVWVTWLLIAIGVLTFIVSYTLYGRKMDKNIGFENIDIVAEREKNMLNTIENEATSEVSLTLGKSVNEIENSIQEEVVEEKIAVNTSAIENKEVTKRNEEKSQNTNSKVEDKKVEDPVFLRPVNGDIIKDYSVDNLVYSNTLEEWTTHTGIDYKAEKTSIVKASADGVVKSIKNDPRYGLTVIIEHVNGFATMYSNLLSTEFISVGERVVSGQTIATVGNTAAFEIADETHLHFEILKDGLPVDPNIYLLKSE